MRFLLNGKPDGQQSSHKENRNPEPGDELVDRHCMFTLLSSGQTDRRCSWADRVKSAAY